MLRYIYWATLLIICTWWWSLSWKQICVVISFKHFSPLFTLHLHCHLHQSPVQFCYVMSTNNCLIDNLYWISFFNNFFLSFSFHFLIFCFLLFLIFMFFLWHLVVFVLVLCICSFFIKIASAYIALQHTNPIYFNVFVKEWWWFWGFSRSSRS
jgi:hypothetical protein